MENNKLWVGFAIVFLMGGLFQYLKLATFQHLTFWRNQLEQIKSTEIIGKIDSYFEVRNLHFCHFATSETVNNEPAVVFYFFVKIKCDVIPGWVGIKFGNELVVTAQSIRICTVSIRFRTDTVQTVRFHFLKKKKTDKRESKKCFE